MARGIKGLPELMRKLEKLRTKTGPQVTEAIGKAADTIVASMKNLVPVDRGALRDSIGWTFGEAPRGSLRVATVKQGRIALTIYAGNKTAYYARWVEFGTAPHTAGGKFKGAEHPGTRPRPFFYPAWRANKKGVIAAQRKAISAAVKAAIR